MARFPNEPPEERTDKHEKGLYQYFDMKDWGRKHAHFVLKYEDIAERPPLPPDPVMDYNVGFSKLFLKEMIWDLNP